jgi:hypothetical protein
MLFKFKHGVYNVDMLFKFKHGVYNVDMLFKFKHGVYNVDMLFKFKHGVYNVDMLFKFEHGVYKSYINHCEVMSRYLLLHTHTYVLCILHTNTRVSCILHTHTYYAYISAGDSKLSAASAVGTRNVCEVSMASMKHSCMHARMWGVCG